VRASAGYVGFGIGNIAKIRRKGKAIGFALLVSEIEITISDYLVPRSVDGFRLYGFDHL
jgi:hypothetical protein